MRLKRLETGAKNYTAKIELVPSRSRGLHLRSPQHHGGQREGRRLDRRHRCPQRQRQWHAQRQIASPEDRAVAFAVEVARGHITWFYNGEAIGTVRNRAAVSDVPLTMRLSLVGDQNREMNKTRFISDWQRGFDLRSGKSVTNGRSLRSSEFSGGC